MTEHELSPAEITALKQVAAKELQEQFQRCNSMVTGARTGMYPASPDKIAELEDRLQIARKACVEAGIEVESTAEWIARTQAEDKAALLPFAQEAAKVRPILSAWLRDRLAVGGGIILGAYVLYSSELSTEWTVAAALLTAVLGWGAAWGLLYRFLPTPAEVIGMRAARAMVDVSECFPADSLARKEYEFAARHTFYRMKKNGELIRYS